MTPNIDNPDRLLIKCDCGGDHFVELGTWYDEPPAILTFTDEPSSLWHYIKAYWTRKRIYHHEIVLSDSDVKRLRDQCNKMLKNLKK